MRASHLRRVQETHRAVLTLGHAEQFTPRRNRPSRRRLGGWGTWIRTKDARVRAGSFTAKLSPNGILPDQTRRQRGGGISMVSLQGQHGERMLLAPVGFARRQCRVKLSQDHLCLKGSLIRWMISPPLPPDQVPPGQVPPGQVPRRGAAPMGRLSRRWTSGRIIADCWWAHRRGMDFA